MYSRRSVQRQSARGLLRNGKRRYRTQTKGGCEMACQCNVCVGTGRCRACRGTGEIEASEPRSFRRTRLNRFEFPGPQFYGIWRYRAVSAVMTSAKPTTEGETMAKPDPALANPECAGETIRPCSAECWRPCDRCHKLLCEKHSFWVPVWPPENGACDPADMVCRQCIAELWGRGNISQDARGQYLY